MPVVVLGLLLTIAGLFVTNVALYEMNKLRPISLPKPEVESEFKKSWVTPSKTPTPVSKTKPVIKAPTTAPQEANTPPPSLSKVPVVLSHNGLTYYCDASVAQSVKDASTNLKNSQAEQIECLNRWQDNKRTCSENCRSNNSIEICSNEMVRTSFGYSSYDDCTSERQQKALDCIDDCYQNPLTKLAIDNCYSMTSSYSQSLNDLLDKYCR